MPMVRIFEIIQRTEDSSIVINTTFQNPLIVLDLLINAQKLYLAKAGESMELKKESAIITEPKGSAIIT